MIINSCFSNGSFVMNKPNTEIKRWGIVVVQSLNPNDVKTGENLYHDVLQYKEYHKREIVGTDISRLTFNGRPANTQSTTFKLTEQCTYLSSEGLSIEEFVTDDTNKRVWIIHIPKHLPRRPVLAHKKAWQRIEDSLVEMTNERMSVILEEPIYTAKDWSAEIVPDATIDDLDEVAIAKARMMFKKVHSRIPAEEVNAWSVQTFLGKCGLIRNGGISLGIAKNTNQLSSYTKTKGLDKERLRQMVLQYLSNAGEEGAKRDSIYEYLKDVLPRNKTEEQQIRMLGDLLKSMSKESIIKAEGRTWYIVPQI